MFADDFSDLFVGELLAHSQQFGQRDGDISDESGAEEGDVGEEEYGADGAVEVRKVFQYRVCDEHEKRDDYKQDCTLQQFVKVVFADELANFPVNEFPVTVHFPDVLGAISNCRMPLFGS